MLCDDPEGWNGGGGGEGGDTHIIMADLHCCTGETNITL